MPEVTANMMITLDGYASGEGQSLERPFGDIDTDRTTLRVTHLVYRR